MKKNEIKRKGIDWKKLDKEKAQFVFDQSKEYLEKTLYVSDQLEKKAFKLLGISLTLMNGLIAYVSVTYSSLGFFLYFLIGYIVLLFIANLFFLFSISLKAYHLTGNRPVSFLQNRVLKEKFEDIVIGETENYEVRIAENLTRNKEKANKVKMGLYFLVFSPILLVFAFFPYIIAFFHWVEGWRLLVGAFFYL